MKEERGGGGSSSVLDMLNSRSFWTSKEKHKVLSGLQLQGEVGAGYKTNGL